MNEWEAPESNKTAAGTEFTRNVPSTTSEEVWASSTATWFTWSLPTDFEVFAWGGPAAACGVLAGGGPEEEVPAACPVFSGHWLAKCPT